MRFALPIDSMHASCWATLSVLLYLHFLYMRPGITFFLFRRLLYTCASLPLGPMNCMNCLPPAGQI